MGEKVWQVNEEEFQEEVLAVEEPVLVDFWAPWCGPCRAIAPILEELAADLEGQIKVVKVNVDDNKDLAGKFRIMSIPTLLLIRKGEEVSRIIGSMSKEDLLAKLAPYL